jgi:hypothetical protein
MSEQQFEKVLTANDTGRSGGHQAGIHIPKGQRDLLAFLPPLDRVEKNPSVWLSAEDEGGGAWQFRYIHYNNRLHDEGGTRDEFRITHMTGYFRASGAEPGDILVIRGEPGSGHLRLEIRRDDAGTPLPNRVRLRGWRRVH